MRKKAKRRPARAAPRTNRALDPLPAPLPGGIQAKAQAKVGSSDFSRLSWLLGLLNTSDAELSKLTDHEVITLQAEVQVFCDTLGQVTGGQPAILTSARIVELVRYVRKRVMAMLEDNGFELEIRAITFWTKPGSRVRYMGEPEALFLMSVARLIEDHGQRIKVCTRPGCGRLFVHKKRALYCGRECSQMAQYAKYLERHGQSNAV